MSRKVTLVSRTVADLTAQYATISDATMTSILDASAAVISPFNSSTLRVTVSQVKIDANGNVSVEWSDTRGGTSRCGAGRHTAQRTQSGEYRGDLGRGGIRPHTRDRLCDHRR